MITRRRFLQAVTALPLVPRPQASTQNWPSFRGPLGSGVGDGFPLPTSWNADPKAGPLRGVGWRAAVPGLGHSSPVVWNDRIFVPTAIAEGGPAPLRVAPGGRPEAADDNGVQSWVVLCFDKNSGRELWRRTARQGKPGAQRHAKATHANTSLATDGRHLAAFFGSEGLHCYDLDDRLLWSRDLGTINVSKYGIGWGYASSPAIAAGRVVVLCDDPENPFLAAFRLSDGHELWRASRQGLCQRSWGTPLIHSGPEVTQVVANGWPWIASYDLETGRELWRLRGGGDNPAPTPFAAKGWIYITNAHGGPSPIYVVRPGARGDISLPEGASSTDAVVWSRPQGGSYMSTPVVYGDHIFFATTRGAFRCFDASTGSKLYEKRLARDAAVYSSLVAADGKIFCAAENGKVYVIKAGSDYQLLATNNMSEPCYATPAISQGRLYFRTTGSLISIG
ncbi:MAG: PQQ-binding-like beta-propeller repeat protein [Acidobacteriota bacterium]